MTDIIATAHPFDEALLDSLASWHEDGAKKFRVNATLGNSHRAAAALVRQTITLHNELSQRFLETSTELHLSEYERAELLKEVVALRGALQQARDTRPNENYKVVTIELEIVDALLGGVKP